MRKINLLTSFILLFISLNVGASDGGLFSYNRETVENELSELTVLEDYLWDNSSTTLSNLLLTDNLLVSGLSLNNSGSMNLFYGEPPLGVPSFLWGCVFGFVGIGIVYFVAEDPEETQKALYGCITGTLISGVLYAVAFSATYSSY